MFFVYGVDLLPEIFPSPFLSFSPNTDGAGDLRAKGTVCASGGNEGFYW